MTLFEYVSIAYSVVLSFACVRLIQGIHHAAKPGKRYWLHLAFTCWQLLVSAIAFWIMWSYHDVTWTLPRFLLVLMSLGLLYHNAAILIPEDPASVDSWRDHFFEQRRRYFLGVAAWIVSAAAASSILLDLPLNHPARMGHLAIFLVALSGLATRNAYVLGCLAIIVSLLSILMVFVAGARPGSFAS